MAILDSVCSFPLLSNCYYRVRWYHHEELYRFSYYCYECGGLVFSGSYNHLPPSFSTSAKSELDGALLHHREELCGFFQDMRRLLLASASCATSSE